MGRECIGSDFGRQGYEDHAGEEVQSRLLFTDHLIILTIRDTAHNPSLYLKALKNPLIVPFCCGCYIMKRDYRQQPTNNNFFDLLSGDYCLRLQLWPNDILKATLTTCRPDEEFSINIDRRLIEQDPACEHVFAHPADILEYLRKSPRSATLEPGLLRIVHRENERTREIVIKMKKLSCDKPGSRPVWGDQEREWVRQMLEEKDGQIRRLEQIVRAHEERIAKLEEGVGQRKDVHPSEGHKNNQKVEKEESSDRERRYEKEERSQKEGRRQKERKRRYMRKDIEQLPPKEERAPYQPPSPPPPPKQVKIAPKLSDDPENPHRSHFECSALGPCLVVTHTADGWSTFILCQQILPGQSCTFSTKIAKSSSNRFCIGFGSKQAFGNKKGSHPYCLFYLSNGNIFYGNDLKKPVEVKTVEGERVKATCDLKRNEVAWRKDPKDVGYISLPHYLCGKPLFFMILVSEKDAQFEVTPQQ